MSLAIIRVIGIILFLYLTWRNLRGDYQEEKLITFGWISVIFFLVFGRIGFGLLNFGVWKNWTDWFSVWQKPGMDYLMATFGFTIAAFWISKVNQWKFFAFMEDNLKNFLVFIAILMIDELVRSRFNIESLFYLLIFIIAYIVSLWLSKRYRSFVWYRSGKKGFVFLVTSCFIFLSTTGILFWFNKNIFLIILSILASLISFVGLFILGEVFQSLSVNKRRKNENG
jgi:hypothetical protein